MVYRWKHSSVKQHLLGILQGFAELVDGLITLCSLGYLASDFEIRVAAHRARFYIKERKNKWKEIENVEG